MPDIMPGGAEDLREKYRHATTMSIPEAGRFFGLGINASYDLHKRGEFPVRVLQLGKKLRVPVVAVARALEIDLEQTA